MTRKLTKRERHHLAGALSTAAADMLGRRYDPEDPEDAEVMADAYRSVALWLARMPGDEWDVRLPQPERGS